MWKPFMGSQFQRHGKIMWSCATFQIQGTLWVQPLLGKKRRPGDFKRDPEEMWECSPIPATGYAGIQGFGGFRLVKTFNCFYGLIRGNYKGLFTPPYYLLYNVFFMIKSLLHMEINSLKERYHIWQRTILAIIKLRFLSHSWLLPPVCYWPRLVIIIFIIAIIISIINIVIIIVIIFNFIRPG